MVPNAVAKIVEQVATNKEFQIDERQISLDQKSLYQRSEYASGSRDSMRSLNVK